MSCLYYFQETHLITSKFLASSIQVNPVIIRKIILQLKAADLVKISQGKTGIKQMKSPEEISLYDIYLAVECVGSGKLFHFHNPNPKCPVGEKIHDALDGKLNEIQDSMEEKLKQISMRDILKGLEK